MNYKKTIAALAMVAIMVPTSLPALSNAPIMSSISITQTLTTNAATGRLYYQKSSTWSKELQSSGCGLFSTANAIYALNGKKMDINALASWAKSNGGWKPGNGGTVRDTLFSNITSKYGNSYGFKVVSKKYGNVDDKALQNHLSNGGGAIAHVGTPGVNGHFIALVGYKNNKFLVIDSVNNRCAGINGYDWMSSSFLKSTASSNSTRVDWFCLISKNGIPPLLNYFPKYTGSSTSIVTALKALGIDSSYDYRKKIATANSISNYSGTASQNTTMLNKLKAGTLIKP